MRERLQTVMASGVPLVFAAVTDMFFCSKIDSVAGIVGVKVFKALDALQLEQGLAGPAPRLILLDLNSSALAPIETIRRIKGDARLARIPIVGFLSHVQQDLAQQAREAGCDRVMSRSAFSSGLAGILESAR